MKRTMLVMALLLMGCSNPVVYIMEHPGSSIITIKTLPALAGGRDVGLAWNDGSSLSAMTLRMIGPDTSSVAVLIKNGTMVTAGTAIEGVYDTLIVEKDSVWFPK